MERQVINCSTWHESKKKKRVTIAPILPTKNRSYNTTSQNDVIELPPQSRSRPGSTSSSSLNSSSILRNIIIPKRQKNFYTDLANEVREYFITTQPKMKTNDVKY